MTAPVHSTTQMDVNGTTFASTLREGDHKRCVQVKTLTSTLLGSQDESPLVGHAAAVGRELIRNVMGTFVTHSSQPEVTEAVAVLNSLKTDRWRKVQLYEKPVLEEVTHALTQRPATALTSKLPGWRMQERIERRGHTKSPLRPHSTCPPLPPAAGSIPPEYSKLKELKQSADMEHTPVGEIEYRKELLQATLVDNLEKVITVRQSISNHQAHDLDEARLEARKLREELISEQEDAQARIQNLHQKYMGKLHENDRLLEYCKTAKLKATESENSALQSLAHLDTVQIDMSAKLSDLQHQLDVTSIALEETTDREQGLLHEKEGLQNEKRKLTDRVQNLMLECKGKALLLEEGEKERQRREAGFMKQKSELEEKLEFLKDRSRASIVDAVGSRGNTKKTEKLLGKVAELESAARRFGSVCEGLEARIMEECDCDGHIQQPRRKNSLHRHGSARSGARKSRASTVFEIIEPTVSLDLTKTMFLPNSRLFYTANHLNTLCDAVNELLKCSTGKFAVLWERMKLNTRSGGLSANPYKAMEEVKTALYSVLKQNCTTAEGLAKRVGVVARAAIDDLATYELQVNRGGAQLGDERLAKREKIVTVLSGMAVKTYKKFNLDSKELTHEAFEDFVASALEEVKGLVLSSSKGMRHLDTPDVRSDAASPSSGWSKASSVRAGIRLSKWKKKAREKADTESQQSHTPPVRSAHWSAVQTVRAGVRLSKNKTPASLPHGSGHTGKKRTRRPSHASPDNTFLSDGGTEGSSDVSSRSTENSHAPSASASNPLTPHSALSGDASDGRSAPTLSPSTNQTTNSKYWPSLHSVRAGIRLSTAAKRKRQDEKPPWKPSGVAPARVPSLHVEVSSCGGSQLSFDAEQDTLCSPSVSAEVEAEDEEIGSVSGSENGCGWVPCSGSPQVMGLARHRLTKEQLVLCDEQGSILYAAAIGADGQTTKVRWRDIEVLHAPDRLILGSREQHWVVEGPEMRGAEWPEWSAPPLHLFSSAFMRWVLCSGDGVYLMQSKATHDGALPYQISEWQVWGPDGWTDSNMSVAVPVWQDGVWAFPGLHPKFAAARRRSTVTFIDTVSVPSGSAASE